MAAVRADALDPRGAFKAPRFSGKREDFENWVFRFESYAGMLGWDGVMAVLSTS